MNNINYMPLNRPSLGNYNFFVEEEDGSTEKIDNILKVKFGEKKLIGIDSTFFGIDYLSFNEPSEARWINYCIYETNLSGKGYKIINNLNADINLNFKDEKQLVISSGLIEVNDHLYPLQGEYEGKEFSKNYNFIDTYLSLRIFFSREPIDSIDSLDEAFYSLTDVVLDTKLPFIREF